MTKQEIKEVVKDTEMLEVMMIAVAYDGLDYVDCFPN